MANLAAAPPAVLPRPAMSAVSPTHAARGPDEPASATRAARDAPLLSVVVPVRNEAANILPLITEIRAALAGEDFEIVYVDDGSTDATEASLASAPAAPGPVRVRRHRASCGQSAAVVTGVRAARGTWIATLDGDGQNDPADIPALFARALQLDAGGDAEGAGRRVLIAGHRTKRRDRALKRVSSRIANGVRAWLLRDRTPDTGCGLKVFRRDLFLELPHFDGVHRYLPALVLRAGGVVESVPVNHRPRLRGRSNYGTLDRLWVGIWDLVGVSWLQRRWRRPELEPGPGGGE